MPGILTTIVFAGINDQVAEALAAEDPWYAYDSYRRFLTSWGGAVMGVDLEHFGLIEEAKRRCPGSGEAREVVVKVLYAVYVPGKWPSHPVNGGVWDTRTLTVPLAVGDGQVPAFLMADTARWDPSGLQVDSVYVAGEADDA